MMTAAPLWSVSQQGTFLWRSWDDDEPVVFHSASGATHVLTPPAAIVLKKLGQSNLSFDEILDLVAEAMDCPRDERLTDQIQLLLHEFDQLGLIEPVV